MDLDRFHATLEELLFNNPLPLSGYSYKESSFNMKGRRPEPGRFYRLPLAENYTDHASSQCADHCGCANGGTLMKPYLLDRVVSAGGKMKKIPSDFQGTLMTATEAANLTELMP